MRFLELRIPPPVVGLVIAAGMWWLARLPPTLQLPQRAVLPVAGLLVVIAVVIGIGGVLSFRRAKTTVNPLKPERSSALVSTGVYSFTRNPMYLGMVLVLLAWAVYLTSAWALSGPVLYALYLTRFQIIPEERVLDSLFGVSFSEYRKRVRRWL
jgi:protein-S-isoprenylcysteine O-methyltransferase Ste14